MSKNPNKSYYKTKHIGQSTKLNAWSQRALIFHIEWVLYNNLIALGICSKSGYKISHKMVQFYLNNVGYL